MSTNEHEHEPTGEERMHALLCAVVLGEASEAERAEVEAALAKSEALRAERARIEATVGLVSSALNEGAAELGGLSAEATAALDRAAAKRARPVWYRTTWMRMAASVAVLALGGIAAMQAMRGTSEQAPASSVLDGERLASREKRAADGRARYDEQEQGDALRKLGYVPNDTPAPAAATPAPAEDSATKLGFDAKAESPASNEPVVEATVEEVKDSLGYAGAPVQPFEVLDSLQAGTPLPDAILIGRVGDTPGLNVADLNGQGQSVPADSVPAPAQGDVALYALTATSGSTSPSVAPSAGPAGPSTPGASAPVAKAAPSRSAGNRGAEAGASGSDNFHLGHGVPATEPAPAAGGAGNPFDRDEDGERLRRLEGLGYVGEDDAAGSRARFERDYADDMRGRLYRLQELHRACIRLPNERPRNMFFRFWGDNPFEIARLDSLSTLSADVDTASYTLARRYLIDGYVPPREQVRTEEFVNYFKGDVQAPSEGTFRVATELAPSLFGDSSDAWMLRVAIRGREVAKTERQPLSLTFVVDVSGSMREENRLELVKHALRMLLGELDGRDSIAIVAFSTETRLVLPMTSAAHRALIESAIFPLQPEGSTNTEAGLRMGYEQAVAALTRNATNRVVLLTDGVANVGITDPNALTDMVARQRKAGIYLNTVGVGMDNHNDHLLEQLADRGDGLCNYVDDAVEVRRALVDNFTGAFEPIARDLKIQVEFDPAQVERYRLLGYENRAVADQDFRNAAVDAAEVGAGHQVVALYEIERRGGGDGPLAIVRLRYKQPHRAGVADVEGNEEIEVAHRVQPRDAAGSYDAASAGYRRSVLVAQFAEMLRRSVHARRDSLERLIAEAQRLAPALKDPEFDEFTRLVERSRDIVSRSMPPYGWYERCGDEIRHRCYLEAQIDELRRRLGRPDELGEVERGLRDVEQRLRELELRAQSLSDADGESLLRDLQAENIALQRALLDLAAKSPSKVK